MAPPQSLQDVLTWPIHAKGAIKRHNPLGDQKIEKHYHQALEDGRWLEQNTADANHWLLQKKQYVADKIKTYTDMNSLAVDAQLKHRPRVFKLAADSIRLLQTVNGFQRDIVGLIQAITGNIGLLTSMEQNIAQMVQSNLNALAILLNNICNWGLPDIPAIPNFFSDTAWWWNGFNFFPLAAFKPQVGFDTNFAFNLCQLHVPNINIFRNYPSSVQTYSDLSYGTVAFVPPLGGIIPNTGQNLSDPNFIETMQVTNTAVYGPTFNPNSSMLGAVPDPATIISNYQMPYQTYHDSIVSIIPTLRGNTIEPADPDYANPNTAVGSDRYVGLRKDLTHYITLDEIVTTNYDPFITTAWLFYLDNARNGRSGTWLPQYEYVYQTYVAPSLSQLALSSVPWNNVLQSPGIEYRSVWSPSTQYNMNDVVVFNGVRYLALVSNVNAQPDHNLTNLTWEESPNVTYQNTPQSVPLVNTLTSVPAAEAQLILWKLSYIEASLLGYTRSKTWDTHQDANYTSGVTGSDLDYVPTVIDFNKTSTITLGLGTASFPVQMTYPTSMTATLNQVITQATADIAADTTYTSPRLSNRFIYNQFAQATLVDRFTQFWRDFASNMMALLAQDPYLIQFATTYFGTLNGALNPLGDQTAYTALKQDVASRSRSWLPGNPLLRIPVAPIVTYTNNTSPTNSGWQGTQFDVNAFLARPDIQGQPIPVQIAMLRTNLSYAGLLQYKNQALNALTDQINNAKNLLQAASQFGFKVESTVDQTVLVGADLPVAFDLVDFDITGNVTDSTTFTIQAAGEYAVFGALNWETPAQTGDMYSVTLLQNNMAILSMTSDPSFTTPYALQFTTIANFAVGDVVQVIASHTYPTGQTLGSGSFFSMVQSGPTDTTQVPSSVTSNSKTFTAKVNMPTLTTFGVQSNGKIAPIDPTVVTGHVNAAISNVAIAGNVLTISHAAISTALPVGSTIYNFFGLTTATFLNGQSVTVLTSDTTHFTAAFVHANYPSASDTGTANGGTIIFPNPDGVTLAAATANNDVECGTNYGGVYQVSGAGWTVGGLLYVDTDGTLTQDYSGLIASSVAWIICVGRAMATDTFIYEPHIPTRILSVM